MQGNSNGNEETENLNSQWISYTVRKGASKTFDVSREACEPFGFYSGERVRVPSGRNAWVIGVRKKELFFHIDGDKGASYYGGYTKKEFAEKGFQLLTPRQHTENKEPRFHAPQFKELLKDTSLCDVIFQLDSVSVPAHRNILVARSQYFKSMFQSGMQESQKKTVTIQDIDEASFRAVLEFLYTGTLDLRQSTDLISLMHAADLFQLDDLKDHLVGFYKDVINKENIWNLYSASDKYNQPKLKEVCKDFILEHYESLMDQDNVKHFITQENSNLVVDIMQSLSPPSKKRRQAKI
jgi:hypothetical protein